MTKRRFTDQFQVLRRTLSKGMGSFSQNLAEPWMAEQSVQGRIHSVFWEKLPTPLRGADWLRKFLNSSSHTPPRA